MIYNLLGIFVTYSIYLVFVVAKAREKKRGSTYCFGCCFRLLLIFLAGYLFLELTSPKEGFALFFTASFSAFIFVFIIDMIAYPLLGFSSFLMLEKFVFGKGFDEQSK